MAPDLAFMKIDPQGAQGATPSPDQAVPHAQAETALPEVSEEVRERGVAMFLRANDAERFRLLEAVVDDVDSESFGWELAAGILRCAWDTEPYLNGRRAGNYLTALGYQQPYVFDHFSDLLDTFGPAMMMPEEREELASMTFPLTVYRGGTGDPRLVAFGMSWTLSREIADFFAHEWPAKFGNQDDPVVVCRQIDRDDVAAYFNDRGECEIVVTCGDPAPPTVVN